MRRAYGKPFGCPTRAISGYSARGRVAGMVVTLALVGCAAGTGGGVLHYHVEEGKEAQRVMWPAPPEVPRYMYAGELTGESNFKSLDDERRKGLQGLFNWVVGLFESQPVEVVLQRPQSGAIDEQRGRIYVTDVSRQGVYVFDQKQGRLLLWEYARGFRRFVAPIGVALGAEGEVLVSDAELGMVVRLDQEGNFVGTIGERLLKRPTGLARDPAQGLVFVADTHAHDIKVFDDAGRLLKVIGHRGEGPGEFNFPTHLAFANGELYVTDTFNNRIQVFSREGDLSRRFGQRGLYVGNLVRPKGVAVDDEGNVYVVESYYDHLLVFNAAGQFLLGIGGTGQVAGKFFLPAGVWIDQHNRVFVADMFNGRVVIFQFLGGTGG